MSVVGWLIVGVLAGVAANRIAGGRFPGGIFGAILGGLFGGFLGGALFSLARGDGGGEFEAVSLAAALVGAAALLALLRLAGHGEPQRPAPSLPPERRIAR